MNMFENFRADHLIKIVVSKRKTKNILGTGFPDSVAFSQVLLNGESVASLDKLAKIVIHTDYDNFRGSGGCRGMTAGSAPDVEYSKTGGNLELIKIDGDHVWLLYIRQRFFRLLYAR